LVDGGTIGASIGGYSSLGGQATVMPPAANPLVGKEEGQISQLDIEAALPFNRGLSVMTLRAQELRDALEWSVAGVGLSSRSTQFPQVAGLTLHFDPAKQALSYSRDAKNQPVGIATPGERVRYAAAQRPDGTVDVIVAEGKLQGEPQRLFKLVTIDTLADGGDDYYPLTLAIKRTDLAPSTGPREFSTDGTEQKTLADYLQKIAVHARADTLAESDTRIQNFAYRTPPGGAPVFTGITCGPEGVTLRFSTMPEKTYVVEATPSLDVPWRPTDFSVKGNGAEQTIRATSPLPPIQLYRVLRRD
jgi:hypothetical protein